MYKLCEKILIKDFIFVIAFLWLAAYAATPIPVIIELEPNNNSAQAL